MTAEAFLVAVGFVAVTFTLAAIYRIVAIL